MGIHVFTSVRLLKMNMKNVKMELKHTNCAKKAPSSLSNVLRKEGRA